MFTRDLVRDLVLAYHKGESIISIREKLDESKPWEIYESSLPAPRVNFLAASNNGTTSIIEDEITKKILLLLK